MSNTKHLADLLKVCSILPVFAIMPAMAGTGLEGVEILDYSETSDMYNLNSNGVIGSFSGYDASDRFEAAVVFVGAGQELSVSDNAVVQGNKAQVGGAIAISGNQPGATLNIGKGVKFLNNTALFDGGAIGNYGNTIVAEGVLFQGNKAQLEPENNENQIGGGAISLGARSKTTIVDTDFRNNESGYNGGAIATRLAEAANNSVATLNISDSDFIGNKANGYKDSEDKLVAGNGGAIYNTFYTDVTVEDTDFQGNYAANKGGAIYNDGAIDSANNLGGVMTINGTEFEGNESADSGGAIYNSGTLTINGGTFADNKAGFFAGAVYNTGEGADLTAGDLTIKNAIFVNNSAVYAGAVAAGTSANNTYIENTRFEGNTADEIGALAMFSTGTLKNVVFYNNKATSADAMSDGAGALFLGAVSSTDVDGVLSDSVFDSNISAARGGAIATRSFQSGNNTAALLDIKNTMFKNNIAATNGGAIDNFFYHSATSADAVYLTSSVFDANSALNGGAIYNHGTSSVQYASATVPTQAGAIDIDNTQFSNNKATSAGGAIYNETGATINMTGNNTFTGNTANGVANDIWNEGALNIASGTTTIDGGILGNGALTIANGATLNIGAASVEQASIALDGTLSASLLDTNNYAKILGTISGTGTVKMTVGAAGTYADVFGNGYNGKLDLGNVYTVTQDGGDIIVETRSAADVMTDTGLSNNAAATMIAMANHTDGRVHAVSLAAQKSLASGDIATIEHETGKLRPSSAPVSQSVATSNHSQILNLAAGRMMGRNGGDSNVGYGAWAQGLFNKSKHDDKFNGYTRGVAVGFDANVDNVYTIGVGYAFNHSDISVSDRNTEVDSNTLFLYGQYKPNQWYVNGTVSYTMADYTEDVSVFGTPFSADYNVDSFGAQAIVGRDFATGIAVEGGLRYLHSSQDSYNNGFGTVKSDDMDFLSGVAGLKYAFAIESDTAIQWRPELRAAATYDFVSDDAFATIVIPGTNPYTVASDRLSRMGGEFGIGLTAEYKGLEVSLNYDLDLHKDYTSQTGMLRFRYDF